MKTRDRILESARALFNEETVAQVSTNRIAAELGISPGNLHYHFQSKQQIVQTLFRRFATALTPYGGADASIEALDDLWLTLQAAFEIFERYRFVHRDIEYLVHEFPQMLPRARTLTAGYIAMVCRVCQKLVTLEILVATPREVEVIALQTVLIATSWHSFAKLALPQERNAGSSGYAAYHMLTLLAPYASPHGRAYLEYLRDKYRA